jgi:SPX domain protein involved in polyphosphate accumulation
MSNVRYHPNGSAITPSSIWNCQQNHPELVVQDATKAFELTPEQQEELRFILMKRGVNKWLLARHRMIKLKHRVKTALKQAATTKERKMLQRIQEELQNIAKAPRWVEWPQHRSKKMINNIKSCIERGNRC